MSAYKFIFGIVMVASSLTSCYDGWDQRVSNGPSTSGTPPAAKKALYAIYFEPIYLSSDAVTQSSCFGATGTATFRSAEWSERIAAILESISKVADSVFYNYTGSQVGDAISSADCLTLSKVETQATTIDRNMINLADDPSDRPIVHLKAVFWDGDVGGTFSNLVLATQWSTWTQLRAKGRPAVSLHYFSLSNKTTGKFSSWSASLQANLVKTATAINTIDPTDAGTASRRATAASDAGSLASWVVTTAYMEAP